MNPKKSADELEIIGFTSIDYAQLVSSGNTVEIQTRIPLKTRTDLEVSVELGIRYHIDNLESYELGHINIQLLQAE